MKKYFFILICLSNILFSYSADPQIQMVADPPFEAVAYNADDIKQKMIEPCRETEGYTITTFHFKNCNFLQIITDLNGHCSSCNHSKMELHSKGRKNGIIQVVPVFIAYQSKQGKICKACKIFYTTNKD